MKTFSPTQSAEGGKRENFSATARLRTEKVDETFDTLFEGKLKFAQAREGYRSSLDAILLAHFVTARGQDKIAELGSGNGVIALMLAHLHESVSVVGIELQPGMAERARRNVQLNGLDQQVQIRNGDVREIKRVMSSRSFDIVVCNPPYRRPASGRISPNDEKRLARHQCEGDLRDFVLAGAYLLSTKGRMFLIYTVEKSVELFEVLCRGGIEPKRVRTVHSFRDAEASLILVEGVKGGRRGVQIQAPLVVYDSGKRYTAEVREMLAGSRIASVQPFNRAIVQRPSQKFRP